jgi:hypothetical protein
MSVLFGSVYYGHQRVSASNHGHCSAQTLENKGGSLGIASNRVSTCQG